MPTAEVIAGGRRIRELDDLKKRHGKGRWRRLKGEATLKLADGSVRDAEVHWYGAHGIARQRLKIKRFLD